MAYREQMPGEMSGAANGTPARSSKPSPDTGSPSRAMWCGFTSSAIIDCGQLEPGDSLAPPYPTRIGQLDLGSRQKLLNGMFVQPWLGPTFYLRRDLLRSVGLGSSGPGPLEAAYDEWTKPIQGT